MKVRVVGQKLAAFGNKLGTKVYGGIKSLGQKVYDNRYKLLAGAAALGVGAAAYAGKGVIQDNLRDLNYVANNPGKTYLQAHNITPGGRNFFGGSEDEPDLINRHDPRYRTYK